MSQESGNNKATVRVTITIQLMSDGQILVSGPIQDKMLCFGMMECAKDAVREFKQQEQSLITPVTLMPKFGN